jgi:acyl carrier protein
MDEKVLLSLLTRELELEPEDLADEEEISMQTLPEWDSLAHTRIILALEKAIGRALPAAEASQADSLAALLELVSQP